MATYKQPCIHCGALIERDSRYCPSCASSSPFGYLCPTCLKPIKKSDVVCSSCGRPLMIPCPYCGSMTFVGEDKCGSCGKSLMIRCENRRCGQLQFFQNTKCTACGKPIKHSKEQIAKEAR
jgi:predicted amidophosphoribosyltransferase